MILDRILCALIVSLAVATIVTALALTRTGVAPVLACATRAAAGLLWLVRRTIRASIAAAIRSNES